MSGIYILKAKNKYGVIQYRVKHCQVFSISEFKDVEPIFSERFAMEIAMVMSEKIETDDGVEVKETNKVI